MVIRALFLLLFALSSCAFADEPFDEGQWRARVDTTDPSLLYAPNFRDGLYFNPWMAAENRGFRHLFEVAAVREKGRIHEGRAGIPPGVHPRRCGAHRLHGGRDFILWVGHSTFLVRMNGEYWITDPVFSDRVVILKRNTPPGLTAAELSAITGPLNVLISHNHYDHLDEESIRGLPAGSRFFVPLGLGKYMRKISGGKVIEMDWWRGVECGKGARVICLPMQHWSKRITQGTNTSLWASFLLVSPRVSVYYAGDSGYFAGYREIGRRYPGIDYVLMPTTAYRPRWFMHYAHMDVQEALDAFKDVGARYFIPTQWGTFHLGEEPPGYPGLDLKRSIARRGLDGSRFLIMDIGQVVELKGKK